MNIETLYRTLQIVLVLSLLYFLIVGLIKPAFAFKKLTFIKNPTRMTAGGFAFVFFILIAVLQSVPAFKTIVDSDAKERAEEKINSEAAEAEALKAKAIEDAKSAEKQAAPQASADQSTPVENNINSIPTSTANVDADTKELVDNFLSDLTKVETYKIDSEFCKGLHQSVAQTYQILNMVIIHYAYNVLRAREENGDLKCSNLPKIPATSDYYQLEHKFHTDNQMFLVQCYKGDVGKNAQLTLIKRMSKNMSVASCGVAETTYKANLNYINLYK